MRAVDFWLLAIFCAVMNITASGLSSMLLSLFGYVAALCALLASFKAFKRDQLALAAETESVNQ
ncbi:hypothetical protein [Xanthomonas hortorum]|uniref:Uncharacterized protein n=1 Tax=Xanthomonas hortorum pv. carotae TaxID=487904 RepID=A0A6V7DK29_9XANT|nr:hypothetical protein [Xanthomonas hortorum]ETC82755.1 hypothetical protein XHC_4464 [Xanthomonas hortorum pv. carotae str. M081]CAD0335804.1 hypothetical protein CFBP7900_22160 [Xanthomonas hortorum pv. carotae]CAD0335813.1 hypothetical protein CFBP7900_22160 [Xanthomonas hortorum pv. carotae]CAD0336060.1 hypothetical protein CFBP7900_22300 [Xanthomonas hortorum pv. carotae]CAD0336068.1 hypothetical protein CFBP7900_22300 [Xanthomonas hortorum pv. carotae]